MMKRKTNIKSEYYLIFLCWLVYTSSYIGRLSYNSNINQIGLEFNMTYSQTGLVTTFFFFAYGIGQVVNGLMCKRYNIKYTIFASLVFSSFLNILIMIIPTTNAFKYIWMLNGISMSFLWTSLIRLLSETISKDKISQSIVIMGTTVATGTFLIYGISAFFVAVFNYHFTFYLASVVLIVVALIWIFSYNFLVNPLKEQNENEKVIVVQNKGSKSSLSMFVIVLALFAIANNLVKDGLTTWTPDILDSLYEMPDWLSILLTLFLPMLGICGTILVVNLHKKIKNFITLSLVLYGMAVLLLITVIVLINYNIVPITIGGFALTSCLMAGVNNIITSMVPLEMKDNVNSGKLAGVLNGFCYIGSTLSAFGLGVIADHF